MLETKRFLFDMLTRPVQLHFIDVLSLKVQAKLYRLGFRAYIKEYQSSPLMAAGIHDITLLPAQKFYSSP